MDRTLLALLVCPETKQPLRLASNEEYQQALALFQEGKLFTIQNSPLKEKPDELLIRQDGKIGYRVVEEIPVLLVQEGILLR